MSIFVTDRATVSGTHRTSDGYLAADARIARTGIQTYAGHEVGRPDLHAVRVYRSPEEVFAPAAMASIAHKAVTLDHPPQNVDATRWKGAAVGWTGEGVTRDGETIRVSMMIADAAAISDIDAGKRELSAGYTCDLDWTPGKTPQGEAYDARQVGIRVNHVAIVAAGRAGSQCRIGDSAAGTSFLRDSAGAPVTLHDHATGHTMRLTGDHIAAIASEAAKAGMTADAYVRDVLKYSVAAPNLNGPAVAWPTGAYRAAGLQVRDGKPDIADASDEWAVARSIAFPKR